MGSPGRRAVGQRKTDLNVAALWGSNPTDWLLQVCRAGPGWPQLWFPDNGAVGGSARTLGSPRSAHWRRNICHRAAPEGLY